jgi:hypothetical protein
MGSFVGRTKNEGGKGVMVTTATSTAQSSCHRPTS